MPEDNPIYDKQTYLITTDDGALFNCAPYAFRMAGHSEECWRLLDTRGATYKGPPYDRTASPPDVQRLVSAWWGKRGASSILIDGGGEGAEYAAQGAGNSSA